MGGAARKRRLGTVMGRGAVLGALALAAPAWAELPTYDFQLQARTNLRGNASGAYNLDPGNLLAGSLQVPLTADRQLAFRLQITPEGPNALWWGQDGAGSRVYLLPGALGEDARSSDPGLNSLGDLAFAVTGASTAAGNGIYLLNVTAPDQVRILRQPNGASNWESLWLNEAGQLGFRTTFSGVGRAYALATPEGAGFVTTLVAREKTLDPPGPYEFLYSPTLNDLGQIAGVGDLQPAGSEWFQELRIFNADGTSTLIAESRGRNPASPIYRFASVQPALNNHGQVAFLATVRDSGNRNLTTLFLWTGRELRVLAQNGVNGIREVEFFPADINDSGLVVFRAIDSAVMRAVWVSDGVDVKRVASEHDILPSDLGPARIDQETSSNPVFAGGPLINARGDISFVAGLAPPENNQEEWGTAIYIARAVFSTPDAGTDGGSEPVDAGVDAGTGVDAGVDAGTELPDSGVDSGTELPDAGSGVDAGSELPDAGSGVDAGSELPDAGVDAGSEPVDAGVDAGTELPDAGADAGTEQPDASTGDDAGTGTTDAGTGTTDAGTGTTDAGTQPDAGTGQPDEGGGCGCQSTPASSLWPWMMLSLAWFLSVRRRGDPRRS